MKAGLNTSTDSGHTSIKKIQQELRITKKEKQKLTQKVTELKKDLELAEKNLRDEI